MKQTAEVTWSSATALLSVLCLADTFAALNCRIETEQKRDLNHTHEHIHTCISMHSIIRQCYSYCHSKYDTVKLTVMYANKRNLAVMFWRSYYKPHKLLFKHNIRCQNNSFEISLGLFQCATQTQGRRS